MPSRLRRSSEAEEPQNYPVRYEAVETAFSLVRCGIVA
jgi:hypothetical protein